jgi:hypothetical protein
MFRILFIALALGAFAMTDMTTPADAQHWSCARAPKDNLRCLMTPQRPQPSKVRIR